jgi:hypothetical protein
MLLGALAIRSLRLQNNLTDLARTSESVKILRYTPHQQRHHESRLNICVRPLQLLARYKAPLWCPFAGPVDIPVGQSHEDEGLLPASADRLLGIYDFCPTSHKRQDH